MRDFGHREPLDFWKSAHLPDFWSAENEMLR